MTQDVKPTRSGLLKIKKRIALATSGHKLLKKKRDGLILEFFKLYKKAKPLRNELVARSAVFQPASPKGRSRAANGLPP